ncbi:MAG: GNAT family N-acetyltransferase [Acidobacteriaceae bacterium]
MQDRSPSIIRPADPADAPGILACLREAFAPFEPGYTPAAFADTVLSPAALEQRMRAMTVLVAAGRTAILATIGFSVHEGEGHIRGMAVLEAWQGTGLAAELLAAAESALRALGCRRVTLDTTQPLTRAIAFYKKHGYALTGQIQDFCGMPLLEFAKLLSS